MLWFLETDKLLLTLANKRQKQQLLADVCELIPAVFGASVWTVDPSPLSHGPTVCRFWEACVCVHVHQAAAHVSG